MIRPKEIQQKAREVGVRDQQIEKDYVLSWILKGIAEHEILAKILVFKGGTVLKKIYFEDYRFSEDLDFTLIDTSIPTDQIFDWFGEIFEYIKEEANIPLEIIDNNEHEDGGINFYISYTGPLGGQGSNKRVKVDISKSEKLEFEPILKPAFIAYSDIEEHQLLAYRLEEVLVEKMRSVMQRMQARDFYDIWWLLEELQMEVEYYLPEFAGKCAAKNLNPADFPNKLSERMPSYKGRWQSSLKEQIQDLPNFEKAEREVNRRLRNIDFLPKK
jgi:predicted nucleotidyltransferase component of viral defense system